MGMIQYRKFSNRYGYLSQEGKLIQEKLRTLLLEYYNNSEVGIIGKLEPINLNCLERFDLCDLLIRKTGTHLFNFDDRTEVQRLVDFAFGEPVQNIVFRDSILSVVTRVIAKANFSQWCKITLGRDTVLPLMTELDVRRLNKIPKTGRGGVTIDLRKAKNSRPFLKKLQKAINSRFVYQGSLNIQGFIDALSEISSVPFSTSNIGRIYKSLEWFEQNLIEHYKPAYKEQTLNALCMLLLDETWEDIRQKYPEIDPTIAI